MLTGKRILAITGDLYEDLELWYPKIRLEEENAVVVVAGTSTGTIKGKHGYPAEIDVALDNVTHEGFDALLLPGGFAPDKLRRLDRVKELTRQFAYDSRLIAFICHGGWIPVSAKVINGRRATGSLGIKDDLENAGAIWVDAPLVADENFISSRHPDDLKFFVKAMIDYLVRRSR
ncbi:MAG: protease [Ectothiorhodospiraceae bacterium]|nr:protease [Ectothiorhodospiraceae bacterium]